MLTTVTGGTEPLFCDGVTPFARPRRRAGATDAQCPVTG